MDWYLAASKANDEERAVKNLENQKITAFSPFLKVEKIYAGKRKIVTEAMFPGYLFIKLSPQDPLWHKVRSTRGVRDWVRFSGNAAKVPKDLVELLIQENKQQLADENVRAYFNQGDAVEILSGPFRGLKGIYQASSGEQRSLILIEFLGKQSLLEMDNTQISC